MFKYDDIRSVHIELSSNCQAKCPMCMRNRRGGVENPNLKINDITFENFKKVISQDFIKQLNKILACGNYGDPILNNDLISIVEYIAYENPKINLMIHTNGSARSKSWWKSLANKMPKNHLVYFALDGLEDTQHIYRIGTSYNKIIENAKSFIDSGGNAAWVFIRFKHNQHQVEEARQRAKDLGFTEFILKETARFIGGPDYDVLNEDGSVAYQLSMPDDSKLNYIPEEAVKNYNKILNEDYEISCKAFHDKEIYIDADMNVWPCCFLGTLKMVYTPKDEPHYEVRRLQIRQFEEMINHLGGLEKLNALNYDIKEIVNNDIWQNMWHDEWYVKKNITCIKTCSKIKSYKISRSVEQVIARNVLDG